LERVELDRNRKSRQAAEIEALDDVVGFQLLDGGG
jgi:hypothetical protein